MELQFKLEGFEGPLDLLLHLINKLEIDIYDIPIAEITEQYLEYLHAMQTFELEIAGEYIVMAATLMAMKSKMLLPTQQVDFDEDSQYEEDPREALVEQLLEYHKYKYAAKELSKKAEERSQFYTKRPTDLQEYQQEVHLDLNQVNTIDLFLAFHHILEKQKRKMNVEATVVADEFSIEDKMVEIQERLLKVPIKQGVTLDSLLTTYNRSEIVITFMALLELLKHQQIKVQQAASYEPLYLYRVEEV